MQTATIPHPDLIRAWHDTRYQELRGEDPPDLSGARLWELTCYLVDTGLGLEDLELLENQDPRWPGRRNRTPRERLARRIGHEYRSGSPRRVLYVLPRRGREPR